MVRCVDASLVCTEQWFSAMVVVVSCKAEVALFVKGHPHKRTTDVINQHKK